MSAPEKTVTTLTAIKREEVIELLNAFALIPSEADREKAVIFLQGMAAASAVAPKATA